MDRWALEIGSVDQARTPAGPCEQRHHHIATVAAPMGAVTQLLNGVQGCFTAESQRSSIQGGL